MLPFDTAVLQGVTISTFDLDVVHHGLRPLTDE